MPAHDLASRLRGSAIANPLKTVIRMGGWLLLLVLIAVPVYAQTPPPAGTWAQIPNTAIYAAMPTEAKTSSTPGTQPELWNPIDVFAYSGADFARLHGVLGLLFWGGGHAATPDNSLYWAPFDSSGPKRLSGPYLAPDRVYKYDDPLETYRSVSRNAPSTVTVAAAPKSRHTYSNIVVIEVNGKPHLFSFGGSLYTGAGGGTGVTRLFDLSQTYEQAMARPDMGWARAAPGPGGATSASCAWDPVQKRVVVRSKSFIGAFYPAENRWENWNIREAPYGSDFEASVAMDMAGRKMYVIGDRLAEVIDLDTKAYIDLRSKPWAADFVKPVWQGGYTNGPGMAWHARTKQIVAWVNRNHPTQHSLLLINPATGVVKTVAMGGTVITSPRSRGWSFFGRFRIIPGTDQVVLANEANQDIYIGTVPFDGGTPVPTAASPSTSTQQPPPAQPPAPTKAPALAQTPTPAQTATPPQAQTPTPAQSPTPAATSLPPSTPTAGRWTKVPLPPIGQAAMATGGKHARLIYDSRRERLVLAGGDWRPAQPQDGNGVGSEVWALDKSGRWEMLHSYCRDNAVVPGRPDTVGWAYDSRRDRAIINPGFYFMSQGNNYEAACKDVKMFAGPGVFEFATNLWRPATEMVAPPDGWGGDSNSSWSVYDPVTDELIRPRTSGGWGFLLERLNLSKLAWRVWPVSHPQADGDHARSFEQNRTQPAFDKRDGVLYFPDRNRKVLWIVNHRKQTVKSVPLPPQWQTPEGAGIETLATFDPGQRVVLLPNNWDHGGQPLKGLARYWVDQNRMEWEPVPPSVIGSVLGFNEATGQMMLIGMRTTPSAYFLYSVGTTPTPTAAPSPEPTPTPPPAPTPSKGQLEQKLGGGSAAPSTTPVASVIVGPSADTLLAGDSQQLMAQVKDGKGRLLAGRDVSWTSLKPETASVSATGLVSGRAPGTAQIVATSEGRSGTAVITVWPTRTDTAECDASKPGWIWCDDFEKDRISSYVAHGDHDGDFVRLPGVGYGGSAGMRARFSRAGQVQGGFLHLAFGKTPWSYLRPVDAGTAIYREIYWRHLVKLQAGWIGSGGNKLSRAQVITNREWAQAMMAHVWSGVASERYPYQLGIVPASGTDPQGRVRTTSYNDFANFRWLGEAWSRTPIFDPMHVGKWYCVEAHARLNDPGKSNGVFELWINGAPEGRIEKLNWQGAYSEYGINTVFLENYWNDGAPQPQERYFDNFVVSTQRIGC